MNDITHTQVRILQYLEYIKQLTQELHIVRTDLSNCVSDIVYEELIDLQITLSTQLTKAEAQLTQYRTLLVHLQGLY